MAASLTARLEVDQGETEIPLQLLASAGIGLRFYLLYAQVGGIYDLLPRAAEVKDSSPSRQLDQPWPGLVAEAGLRVATDFW